MTTHVNDNGTWREASEVHVNDSGTWREASEVHVNDSGTWRLVYTSGLPEATWKFGHMYGVDLKNTEVCNTSGGIVGNAIKPDAVFWCSGGNALSNYEIATADESTGLVYLGDVAVHRIEYGNGTGGASPTTSISFHNNSTGTNYSTAEVADWVLTIDGTAYSATTSSGNEIVTEDVLYGDTRVPYNRVSWTTAIQNESTNTTRTVSFGAP